MSPPSKGRTGRWWLTPALTVMVDPLYAASVSVRSSFRLLPALVILALLLLGCASDPKQEDIIESLRRAGVEEPIAECLAEAFAKLPEADRKLIGQRGGQGVRDDRSDPDEPIDRVRTEMSACRDAAG